MKNNITYYILFPIIILVLISCDIQKEATKSKSDSTFKENIESKTFRKGDTVHYKIPNIIYKDTTIYRVNKQGTTIKTIYDKQGQLTSIDCFASAIEEFRKENRDFKESLKDKESKKTENFDSSFIIYFMIGFVIIICFALVLGFVYLKGLIPKIPKIPNNIT